MAMSLMTAAFAADVDFADADKINNTEAVEVMAAIGVLEGNNGEFNPQGSLTRETAAKIICYMLLGKDGAEALTVSAAPFKDVAADRWSAPFIAYCASEGIIAGNGNGMFYPTAELTSIQFAKMCLIALGYRADLEKLTGEAWAINTSSLAVSVGLNKDLGRLTSTTMTREDAAQMAFNVLTTTLVEYSGGVDVSMSDGTTVTVNATRNYVFAVNGEEFDAGNVTTHHGDGLLQFCEKYFEDLETAVGQGDTFGRPSARAWELDGEQVYNAVAEALVVYASDMDNTSGKKQILSDLKGYKFGTDELKSLTTTASADITITGLTKIDSGDTIVNEIAAAANLNGQAVEIFVNDDKEVTDVVTLTYIVEKVSAISTNRDGDITYNLSVSGSKTDYADNDANDDTVKLHGTVAKGDYVTTYTASDNVVHVYPTTKIVGQQTATNGTTLTISGQKYDLGLGVETDGSNTKLTATAFVNSSKDANYFIDQFGFVVACTDVEVDTAYAVVNKIAAKEVRTGLNTGNSVEAELVLADGTKKTVVVAEINDLDMTGSDLTVSDTTPAITWTSNVATAVTLSETVSNNSALNGQVVTYSVNSDGEYALTFVETPTTVTAATTKYLTNKGVPAFGDGTTKSGSTSTVYVVATTKNSKTVFNSYTGFANVPTIKANGATLTATYVEVDGKIEFVYIDATANSDVGDSTVNNIFYAHDATVTTVSTGDDKYYTIDGILDGVATTIKTTTADFKLVTGSTAPNADTFYELTIDEDGYTTAVTAYSFTKMDGESVTTAIIDSLDEGVVNGLLYNDDTVVYVIDGGDVTVGTVGNMAVGDALYGLTNTTGTAAEQNTLTTLYIVVA